MTAIEIIFAILLILSCVFIIAVVLMQESKQGMSNVISGGSSDNYFQKNSGRTREAKLGRATKIAAVVLFVVAIAVNLVTVYLGSSSDSSASSVGTSGDLSSLVDVVADTDNDDNSAETEAPEAETETYTAETTAASE